MSTLNSAIFKSEYQTLVNQLFNFALNIVIKDSEKAAIGESDLASKNAVSFINACLDGDDQIRDIFMNNTYEYINGISNKSFREQNEYYIELIKIGINLFRARTADDFTFIGYTSSAGFVNDEPYQFKKLYQETLDMYKNTLYTDAFNDSKESYRKFCKFYIVFFTIERFIDKFFLTRLANTNYTNQYFIKNILHSYGINFLDNLLPYYQKKIIKNIDFLIANKGTNSIFEKIFEIFDFDNVELNNYYIIKRDDTDDDTKYDFIEVPVDVVDPSDWVIDIGDDIQDVIVPINDITDDDPIWIIDDNGKDDPDNPGGGGGGIPDDVIIEETKYIGFQIVKYLLDISYSTGFLFSMMEELKFDGRIEKLIFASSLFEDKEVNLFDALFLLVFCIDDFFKYKSVRPENKPNQRLIYNFNDDINETDVSKYYDLNNLPVKFPSTPMDIPITEINKYFNKNINCHNNVCDQILFSSDYYEYMALMDDYMKVFTSENLYQYFDGYSSYKEYLLKNSPNMASFIKTFEEFNESEEDMQKKLAMIDGLISNINLLLNEIKLDLSPSNFIVQYAYLLINFFKSHLKQLVGTSPVFYIDDKLGKIAVFDKIEEIDKEKRDAELIDLTDSIMQEKENELFDGSELRDSIFIERVYFK